ncbi:glycoside hydrolase family 5 protein [Micromonospora sp. NPDC048898]|uniref:glycoside hydrolase family 5 protein n=1 Tax=Micromonospora sp. NPDC048898 TaxID=3364260 RepID=UPI00371D05E4
MGEGRSGRAHDRAERPEARKALSRRADQAATRIAAAADATTTPPPTTPPPTTGTPVERHGQLRVCGTTMCDRSGARVQLRGISSMWLNWETAPYAENLSALTWMRDNWNLQVIRASMGVEPAGAYLSNPGKARAQVETIINNAVSAGVYVIVDWHAHEAQNNQSQAVAFFGDLARRYGHLPNVIWEPYNEPLQVSWTNVIKPYHQAVVSAIRAADPDNIVVLGTPTWSQAAVWNYGHFTSISPPCSCFGSACGGSALPTRPGR